MAFGWTKYSFLYYGHYLWWGVRWTEHCGCELDCAGCGQSIIPVWLASSLSCNQTAALTMMNCATGRQGAGCCYYHQAVWHADSSIQTLPSLFIHIHLPHLFCMLKWCHLSQQNNLWNLMATVKDAPNNMFFLIIHGCLVTTTVTKKGTQAPFFNLVLTMTLNKLPISLPWDRQITGNVNIFLVGRKTT